MASAGHPRKRSPRLIWIAQAANEIGVNDASFRVHHFVPQASAPMPLLGAVAATTKHIEVANGVIDMR